MRKEVKIGGSKLSNVFFTETGENYIFAKDYKEDFFGIYNVTILNETFICKHLKKNYVEAKLEIDNTIYDKVLFKIVKEGREGLILNSKTLPKPSNPGSLNIIEESFSSDRGFIDTNDKLDELIDYKVKRKDLIIEKLQKDIKEIETKNIEEKTFKKNEIKNFFEESIKEGLNTYRESVVKDVLDIEQNRENILEEKILDASKKVSETLLEEITKRYENAFYKKFLTDATHILKENAEFIKKHNQRLKEEIEDEILNKLKEENEEFSVSVQLY
jgi:hypothetical protein